MNGGYYCALWLEQKNEYTDHLVETLTPYIYEGLTCIYKEAEAIAKDSKSEKKTLFIFQKLLQSIGAWNQMRIEEETSRIKNLSNTAEYFDDLVNAVIKANITLLTNNNQKSSIIAQTFYKTFKTSTFIHRCYTECGKDAHNYPILFYNDPNEQMEYKRNQQIIIQNIQLAIPRAIRKVLPISLMAKEFIVSNNGLPMMEMGMNMNYPRMDMNNDYANYPGYNYNNGNQNNLNNMNNMNNMNNLNNLNNMNNLNNLNNDNYNNLNGYNQPLESKLEKEVMDIIKTESIKSDRQKVQALIGLEKIVCKTNMANQPNDKLSSNKKTEFVVVGANRDDQNAYDKESKDNISIVDDQIMNIEFSNEPTVDNINKSVSVTSLGTHNPVQKPTTPQARPQNRSSSNARLLSAENQDQNYRQSPKFRPEVSERVDPSKIDLIENYGSQGQHGGRKLNRKNR